MPLTRASSIVVFYVLRVALCLNAEMLFRDGLRRWRMATFWPLQPPHADTGGPCQRYVECWPRYDLFLARIDQIPQRPG